MTVRELYETRRQWLQLNSPYKMCEWTDFDYKVLSNIMYHKKSGRGSNQTYNDVIIMADTETSKSFMNTKVYKPDGKVDIIPCVNYVVAWTISLRAFDMNIVTLYGHTPTEFCKCVKKIQKNMHGHDTFIYFHNLPFDWTMLRRHIFKYIGKPESQLNVKSHYPLYIKFDNGLVIKDSYILSQRSLERWAEDMDVPHKKAVGKWDYNKVRHQHGYVFSEDELKYIENDTLAGVECIDATLKALNKSIFSIPYTATGIPRGETQALGKENGARNTFLRQCLEYSQYLIATDVYHGGYTHANRYYIECTISELNDGLITCYDFTSSYPFCMLAFKYPCEKFSSREDCSIDYVIENSEDYAYMFKLVLVGTPDKPVRLKDSLNPMPVLQLSKCKKIVNPIVDNGRILQCDAVEIYLNEVDAKLIKEQYHWERHICTEVLVAEKDYLPKWFTDYVYKLFKEKCLLKGKDAVLYSIAKAKLNSLYGMCVQKSIKENLVENYVTGEYEVEQPLDKDGEPMTDEDIYNKYINNRNSILNYSWGCYVTSYAMVNLHRLGSYAGTWLYSDTDSVYGLDWDMDKVEAYNKECIQLLNARGYKGVIVEGETYTLGIAELDGVYSEFRVLGSKRYSCRYAKDKRNKEKVWGKLKITVAGVPKNGVSELNNDINNFTTGLIFRGSKTGKLTHHYIINEEGISVNQYGDEYGDCIDLTECDYLLKSIDVEDIDEVLEDEIMIQIYE